MNKFILTICLTLFVLFAGYSQEKSVQLTGKYFGFWDVYDFSDNSLTITKMNPQTATESTETHSYELLDIDGIIFIELDNNPEKRWLALFNEQLLFLYVSETENPSRRPFFEGVRKSRNRLEALMFGFDKITVSSFLQENETSYDSDNLKNIRLWSPWVEGIDGSGIGEAIEIQCWAANSLTMSIGFVSYEKPYLYRDNSRPKKIKIINLETANEFTIDLLDTPNPQRIMIPEESNHIKIKIEEVYPGNKWNDMCINSIFRF
jgi:hypothetical protein